MNNYLVMQDFKTCLMTGPSLCAAFRLWAVWIVNQKVEINSWNWWKFSLCCIMLCNWKYSLVSWVRI